MDEVERRRLIDDERTTETKAHRCRVFCKKFWTQRVPSERIRVKGWPTKSEITVCVREKG
ncbi:hypothetical protein WH47_01799 [Habropoda laboriosa]|uniref:Uncharacterized protein n=1 Tax=Habropoda laboriosa TaxID=597456 RepID=A0A0L7QTM3_9HYME|nr:hypothetical protein WH47_01799 [Habropoda laboriosa]